MGFWSDAERREDMRARFEMRMGIPVLIAAALLTAVTAVLLFGTISDTSRRTLLWIDFAIWVFFVFDYVVRFTLATPKWRFVKAEWVDLLLVVIPLFQPLRLLGALVRVVRLSAAWERTIKGTHHLMRHKLHIALAWSASLVLIASIVTPLVEPEKSKIETFWDGIWWAVVTTTTVGYGDLVPESVAGRLIGFLLMLAGIGIIGILTANIASFFIEPPAGATGEDDEGSADETDVPDASIDATVGPDVALPTGDTSVEQLVTRMAALDAKLDRVLARLDADPG